MRASSARSQRFLYIDGLRGLAAMTVVIYHLTKGLAESSGDWIPGSLLWFVDWGSLGVDVFFVLSGFVIAHSIRDARPAWSYLWRFGLRRSIRLDPPLWATIVLEVALLRVTMAFFPGDGTALPDLATILANLTYTQQLLGLPSVVEVFWSLTYEVQFYVVLVGSMVILHQMASRWRLTVARFLIFTSILYSLLIWSTLLPLPHPGLFIQRWFEFGLGVLAWAAANEIESSKRLWAWCAVSLLFVPVLDGSTYRQLTILVAVGTATSLYLATTRNRMADWLAGSIIQFLGRISYSLYLLHAPIGWRFIAIVRSFRPGPFGPFFGLLVFVGAVGVSLLGSWILYRLVEAPSMTLARKVSLPRRVATSAT